MKTAVTAPQHHSLNSVLQSVELAAATDGGVLITGGPGKIALARTIHNHSRRRGRPFVTMTFSGNRHGGGLDDVELFGVLEGIVCAPLVANAAPGLVKEAESGTLFLDQVDQISPMMQARLLQLITEGAYARRGDHRIRRANIRVIAGTNLDLQQRSEAGLFRPDLLEIIAGVNVLVPQRGRNFVPALIQRFSHEMFTRKVTLRPVPTPRTESRI